MPNVRPHTAFGGHWPGGYPDNTYRPRCRAMNDGVSTAEEAWHPYPSGTMGQCPICGGQKSDGIHRTPSTNAEDRPEPRPEVTDPLTLLRYLWESDIDAAAAAAFDGGPLSDMFAMGDPLAYDIEVALAAPTPEAAGLDMDIVLPPLDANFDARYRQGYERARTMLAVVLDREHKEAALLPTATEAPPPDMTPYDDRAKGDLR